MKLSFYIKMLLILILTTFLFANAKGEAYIKY